MYKHGFESQVPCALPYLVLTSPGTGPLDFAPRLPAAFIGATPGAGATRTTEHDLPSNHSQAAAAAAAYGRCLDPRTAGT